MSTQKNKTQKNKTQKNKTQKNRKQKRKSAPWTGWEKLSPNQKEREEMLYKCGKKCFLGTKVSFPICQKKTCKKNRKGIWAAYIRAAQWENKKRGQYTTVKNKAKKLLKRNKAK